MSEFWSIYLLQGSGWFAQLSEAALYTISISFAAFLIAIPTAVMLMVGKTSKNLLFQISSSIVIELVRGIPTLVWLFVLYFALPQIGILLNEIVISIACLGIIGGGYMAEILRGGLYAIAPGQREAAYTVGLTPAMTWRFIILPQLFRLVLPPILNVLVSLLKESSVAALISTPELTLRAKDLATADFRPMHLYLLVGVFYFALGWPLSLLVRRLDRQLHKR